MLRRNFGALSASLASGNMQQHEVLQAWPGFPQNGMELAF
jgi:hypothetical protein